MRNILMIVSMALLLGSCTSKLYVDAVYDESADFSVFNTYDWALDQEPVKGDFPEFDNKENRQRIQNAIDKEMQAIGFVKSTQSPDILVDFHVSIDEKVAYIDHSNYDFEYWEDYNPDVRPHVYKEGSLIIHLVENKTEKLVWEGIGDKTLNNVPPKNVEERMAKAVRSILAKYPIKK